MAEDEGLAQFVFVALRRHSNHDWGDCCEEDRKANDWSWQHDGRILSVYKTDKVPDGKIWIITEWDRSVTTILLPSEY